MTPRRSITNPLLHLTPAQEKAEAEKRERVEYRLNLGRFEDDPALWWRELRGQGMAWLERMGIEMRLRREALLDEVNRTGAPSFDTVQQFWLDLRRIHNDDMVRAFKRDTLHQEVREWLKEQYGIQQGIIDLIYNNATRYSKSRVEQLASIHAQAETHVFHPGRLYGDHWTVADDGVLLGFLTRFHIICDERETPVRDRSRTLNTVLGQIASMFNHPGTIDEAYASIEEFAKMPLTGNAVNKVQAAKPAAAKPAAAQPSLMPQQSASADKKMPSPFGGGNGSKGIDKETQKKLEETSRAAQLKHVTTGIEGLPDPKPELFAHMSRFLAWWNWCFDTANKLGITSISLRNALEAMLDVHNVYEYEGTLAHAYDVCAVGLWERGKVSMDDDLTPLMRDTVSLLFKVDEFEPDGKNFKAATNQPSISLALASGKKPHEVLQAIVDWKAVQNKAVAAVTGEAEANDGEKAAPSPAPTPAPALTPVLQPERTPNESDGKTTPEKRTQETAAKPAEKKARILPPEADPILNEVRTLKGFPISQLRFWLNRPHPQNAYDDVYTTSKKKDKDGKKVQWKSLDPQAARRRFDRVFGAQGFGWRITEVPGLAQIDKLQGTAHVNAKTNKDTGEIYEQAYDKDVWNVTMSGFVLEYAVRHAGSADIQWIKTSVLATSCTMDKLDDAFAGAQSGLIKQALKLFGGEDHFRLNWEETIDVNEVPEAV